MAPKTLEGQIWSSLMASGEVNLNQLAVNMGYPLGVTDTEDKKFLGALDRLVDRRMIHWIPASTENPAANDSDPYAGRIYNVGSGKPLLQTFKEAYGAVVEKVRQYF